jgi:hypothetical protein
MIRRSTWIWVGLFAIALVAAFIYQRTKENVQADATPTAGLTYLFDVQDSEVIGLRITGAGGDSVAMQRGEGGEWELSEPEGEPADQSRIDSAVTQVETLRVLSTLEQEPDADVIGLDPAEHRLAITLANGESQEALIGSETPTGSGYYARLEGGGPLQVANKTSVDSVLELLNDPPIAPTPTVTVEETVEVTETLEP